MILPGHSADGLNNPDLFVGLLGVLALSGCGIWAFVRWVLSSPAKPDPWDEEVALELAGTDCEPLCHRCLSAHASQANFCQNCGAAVGTYTNWLPYPYLFSLGHTLRIGTSGNFKRSPLTVGGFFILSLAEYAVFAPVYWYVFLKNLRRFDRPAKQESGDPPVEPASVGEN